MTEVGHFRGEGGVVFDFPLPLSEVMQYKLTRGQLVRVNADGSAYDASPAMDLVNGVMRVPGKQAPKNEWVGYAVSQGMSVDDADAMTKNELVDKFAEK